MEPSGRASPVFSRANSAAPHRVPLRTARRPFAEGGGGGCRVDTGAPSAPVVPSLSCSAGRGATRPATTMPKSGSDSPPPHARSIAEGVTASRDGRVRLRPARGSYGRSHSWLQGKGGRVENTSRWVSATHQPSRQAAHPTAGRAVSVTAATQHATATRPSGTGCTPPYATCACVTEASTPSLPVAPRHTQMARQLMPRSPPPRPLRVDCLLSPEQSCRPVSVRPLHTGVPAGIPQDAHTRP